MVGTNHALTGAVIGLAVQQPLLAVPLALVSHFILDALPHFGSNKLANGTKGFQLFLNVDIILCFVIAITLLITQPEYWFIGVVCAFVACSPDFMWVPEFLAAKENKPLPERKNWLIKFHANIQTYQKELGIIVELVWAALMVLVLAKVALIW